MFSSLIIRFRTLKELLHLFSRGGRWWLLPLLMILILFSLLMMLASATPLGPFIYTLF